MLWAVGAGGGIGLLLGLWFRVPALLAASGISAGVFLAIAPFVGMTLYSGVFRFLALFFALHVGYLMGVGLVSGCTRARLWPSRR
jgi:hypothetical protein